MTSPDPNTTAAASPPATTPSAEPSLRITARYPSLDYSTQPEIEVEVNLGAGGQIKGAVITEIIGALGAVPAATTIALAKTEADPIVEVRNVRPEMIQPIVDVRDVVRGNYGTPGGGR